MISEAEVVSEEQLHEEDRSSRRRFNCCSITNCCYLPSYSNGDLLAGLASLIAAACITAVLSDDQLILITSGNCYGTLANRVDIDKQVTPMASVDAQDNLIGRGHWDVEAAPPREMFIGLSMFTGRGTFKTEHVTTLPDEPEHTTHLVLRTTYTFFGQAFVNCINHDGASFMYVLIGLSIVTLCCVLISAFLQLLAPSGGFLDFIKRRALASVAAVVLSLCMLIVVYIISVQVELVQLKSTPPEHSPQFNVYFARAYYMIVLTALFSVVAIALNLHLALQRVKASCDRINQLNQQFCQRHPDPRSSLYDVVRPPNAPPPYTPTPIDGYVIDNQRGTATPPFEDQEMALLPVSDENVNSDQQ